MSNIDKFLTTYKELEQELRNKGKDIKELEDTQSDKLSAERLRLCRMFRNYLSHNNDSGFLIIAPTMQKFLEKELSVIKKENDTVKKHLKSVTAGTISPQDKCSLALEKMSKLKVPEIVVVTDTGYALASIYTLIRAGKTEKIGNIKCQKYAAFISPETLMKDASEGIFICTSDGTAKGELVGILYQ